uniref:Uncharacterized protein n=1 Tax=Ditylenchus dipsaci TaxID=166011 RepID=A0A915ESA9_9BILA
MPRSCFASTATAIVDETGESDSLLSSSLANSSSIYLCERQDDLRHSNEDDTLGIELSQGYCPAYLGQKSRDEILAALYLARHVCPCCASVRLSCLEGRFGENSTYVIVNYPVLFELCFIACPALVEIVNKWLLVALANGQENALESENVDLRKGGAIALNEILSNTHRDIVETYASTLVPCIRKCLSDSEKTVRDSAAPAFSSFHQIVGYIAVDEIVSPMLEEFSRTNNMIC